MLIRCQLINRLMVAGWLFCAGQLGAAERPEQLDYFETHIRPVLVQHCYACHSAEHSKSEGGLLLDSGPALLHGGDSGPAIEPGQPEASLLLSALRYQSLEMPPAGRLDEETIRHFEHWIAQGAVDPRQDEAGLAGSQTEIDWQQLANTGRSSRWPTSRRPSVTLPGVVTPSIVLSPRDTNWLPDPGGRGRPGDLAATGNV